MLENKKYNKKHSLLMRGTCGIIKTYKKLVNELKTIRNLVNKIRFIDAGRLGEGRGSIGNL